MTGVPCSSVPLTISTSLPREPVVAGEDVRRHAEPRHVADVTRTGRVRPGHGCKDLLRRHRRPSYERRRGLPERRENDASSRPRASEAAHAAKAARAPRAGLRRPFADDGWSRGRPGVGTRPTKVGREAAPGEPPHAGGALSQVSGPARPSSGKRCSSPRGAARRRSGGGVRRSGGRGRPATGTGRHLARSMRWPTRLRRPKRRPGFGGRARAEPDTGRPHGPEEQASRPPAAGRRRRRLRRRLRRRRWGQGNGGG